MVLRGYLDRKGYVMPPFKESKIKEVESLMPSVSKIELHQHVHPGGSELAVVINGDNLWFCNGIEVELPDLPILKIRISADSVTQKQICYNCPLNNFKMPESRSKCPVKVYSKFANPLRIPDVTMICSVSIPLYKLCTFYL